MPDEVVLVDTEMEDAPSTVVMDEADYENALQQVWEAITAYE